MVEELTTANLKIEQYSEEIDHLKSERQNMSVRIAVQPK